MFTEELNFFIANQDRLVNEHRWKVLAIRGNEIIGVYGTPLEAYLESQKRFPVGTFMIQPCEPGPEAYTVSLV